MMKKKWQIIKQQNFHKVTFEFSLSCENPPKYKIKLFQSIF